MQEIFKTEKRCNMYDEKNMQEIRQMISLLSEENKKYVLAVAEALLFSQKDDEHSTNRKCVVDT